MRTMKQNNTTPQHKGNSAGIHYEELEEQNLESVVAGLVPFWLILVHEACLPFYYNPPKDNNNKDGSGAESPPDHYGDHRC